MKEILETIVKALVEKEEKVIITEKELEKEITYQVKVDKEDMGQVIGKQGKVAKSIRTVMKSLAGKEHKKVNVEFIEE